MRKFPSTPSPTHLYKCTHRCAHTHTHTHTHTAVQCEKDGVKKKLSDGDLSFRQAADRDEQETMMHVCNCFKVWQRPLVKVEEAGEDDADG